MAIECLVLGAGQTVGKSCVVATINGCRIMFDCGMVMGCEDLDQFPDFSLISKTNDFDSAIDCVVVTHFHLDHIGGLPYFTEVCGYNGPIYMTYPTKALAPLVLEDYRKNMERRGAELFTDEQIAACLKKVIAVDLKQTVRVNKDLKIRAYYAGHSKHCYRNMKVKCIKFSRMEGADSLGAVGYELFYLLIGLQSNALEEFKVLGAAMFYAKVGDATMVYTGDYNMTPERHLGAAKIDQLKLDLLITESTYATTVRDSKYEKEREFIKAVHECVAADGKVLIPTFAIGRAQEICVLLEEYWERMNLKVPIYFSAGLTVQANIYYKTFLNWTTQQIKETYANRSAFDFRHVQTFDRSMINASGPCVLFATPGMLYAGFSLEVFKHWAPSENNLVALPGHCMVGSVGHKLSSSRPSKIYLDNTQIDVKCKIHQLAFSAHTDSKGIMDLVKFLMPKQVILVHGHKHQMDNLQRKIESELEIKCCVPANNDTVLVSSTQPVKAVASDAFLRSCLNPIFKFSKSSCILSISNSISESLNMHTKLQVTDERVVEGILVEEKTKRLKIMHQDELLDQIGEKKHEVSFGYCCPISVEKLEHTGPSGIYSAEDEMLCGSDEPSLLQILYAKLSSKFHGANFTSSGERLQVESFSLHVCSEDKCPNRISDSPQNQFQTAFLCCNWLAAEEKLAWKIISMMKSETPLVSFRSCNGANYE